MVYLIYGSPCSGKSTYIKEHMKCGDLLCDVDLIYGAISGQEPHTAELYTHEIACELNSVLKDIIRDRKGGWKDAYVVSIANTSEKLKRDADRVGADECIFIDASYETCIERSKDRPPYFVWLIQEWFEMRDFNEQSTSRQE